MNTNWHFEITYRDGQVSVTEYQQNNAMPITNNGEEAWPLPPDFWEWFQKKIVYRGQPISLIIVHDNTPFPPLPENFQLAEHNHCYLTLKPDDTLLAYPELTEEVPTPTQATSEAQPKHPVKQNSLQDYFVRQTQEFTKDN